MSEPGEDFTGGEFVLTEQRPRMQSRAAVVPLRQGDAVVFAVHHRPVQGTRGIYRVDLRHGVSTRALRPSPHARHHLPRRGLIPPAIDARPVRATTAAIWRWPRAPMLLRGFARPDEAALLGGDRGRRGGRTLPPHGDAGRLPHVGRDDQLRRGRLGHRSLRLSLRRRSIRTAASRGRRCRRSFADLATRAAAAAGFPGFVPDACLINRYEPGARLSLHQDRNERDFAAPDRLGLARPAGDLPVRRAEAHGPAAAGAARPRRRRRLGRPGAPDLPRRHAARRRRASDDRAAPPQPDLPPGVVASASDERGFKPAGAAPAGWRPGSAPARPSG